MQLLHIVKLPVSYTYGGMKLCQIVVLVITLIKICATISIFYVLPDNSTGVRCPSQPCYTLQQYLEQNDSLLVVSNVEYHLLPGEHHVPSHVILIGLYNFSMVGTTRGTEQPAAVIVSCLQSFIHIHDSENVLIANVIFQQCYMPHSYERNYETETNLFFTFCVSCTIQTVNFKGYGFKGYDLVGNSSVNNVKIDLSYSTSSYLPFQGISLLYTNLSSIHNYYHTLTINATSIVCHNDGCSSGTYTENAGIDIKLINSHSELNIFIMNSNFYYLDREVIFILNKCSLSKNLVLFFNCTFGNNKLSTTGARLPHIIIGFSRFNMTVKFFKCTFKNNEKWSYLVVLKAYDDEADMCSFPDDNQNFMRNEAYFELCIFIQNAVPLLKIMGKHIGRYLPKVNILGPIEILNNVPERYSKTVTSTYYNVAYFETTIVHLRGPVTIAYNDVENLFFFKSSAVTFRNEIFIT